MSWFIVNFVSAFLLPPLNLLVVMGIGLWLWHKRPRVARLLLVTAFTLLWLLSTPWVAETLLRQLEGTPVGISGSEADAIVVLGGGVYFHAPEYGGDTVGAEALERLRYAAHLQRTTGKPILVSGGTPQGTQPEALLMKQVLEQSFGVAVRWTESASDNTQENARKSAALLNAAGMTRIYLVTHAWHMPRARRVFELAGLVVVPAPTAYTTRHKTDLLAFLPNSRALDDSRWFMHEIIGILWYRLKS